MIKKLINKENLKTVVKEGASLGADVVTETAKGFIWGIFYKIIFIITFIFVLTFGGCVGYNYLTTPDTNETKTESVK